jgi:hypothetical protein
MSDRIRVDTHGCTLNWARCPDIYEALPLAEFEGREVVWEDWDVAPDLTHVQSECERCGYDGQPWMSTGTVPPRAGEMAGKRRAWPLKRLFAFQCPACGSCRVYDRGGHGEPVVWRELVDASGQTALF